LAQQLDHGDSHGHALAIENSINPRLLLGLLELKALGAGQPVDELHTDYPMGFQIIATKA